MSGPGRRRPKFLLALQKCSWYVLFARRDPWSSRNRSNQGKPSEGNQSGDVMVLEIGQHMWIRCKVQPGPFTEEPLVTVESIDGLLSGFVATDELKTVDRERYVRGIVRHVTRDHVEVWIKGSFFTTNGLANVPRELATAA